MGEPFEGEGAYVAARGPERSSPAAGATHPDAPTSFRDCWLDIGYRVDSTLATLEATRYAGDAIPVFSVDMGPGCLPGLLGSPYRFVEKTAWFDIDPPLREWRDRPPFAVDKRGELFLGIQELCRVASEASEGRYVVALPDLGASIDALAALLGRERLLVDFLDEPEAVKEALVEIDALWIKSLDESYALLGGGTVPLGSWIPLAFAGKWCPLSSELTAMVSPEMFEEFALPALERAAASLDRVMFNADGPALIRHLPSLAKLRGLHSIEYDAIPALDAERGVVRKDYAGAQSIDACRRVQAAGLKLALVGIAPDQADRIMREISPDGVFLLVSCTSADEAEDFVAYARKWTRGDT